MLDEPNSNLDAEGEHALGEAIAAVRARGGIVVVVAHRPNALVHCNLLVMIAKGRLEAFGERGLVLGQVARKMNPAAAGGILKVVPAMEGAR